MTGEARSALSISRSRSLFVAFAAACAWSCASKPPRDAAIEGTDVRGDPSASNAANGDDGGARTTASTAESGYEHVARRGHATVALAEARGLDANEASAAVERIADRLEGCARELTPADAGVVRVIAYVGEDGAVGETSVPLQTGSAATALRCVVAPLKLLQFQRLSPRKPDDKARGLALEAEWRPS